MNTFSKILCCLSMGIFFCTGTVTAQRGKIHVNEEWGVRAMLDHRKSLNFEKDRRIKAWSVQLMVTRDKYLVNKRMYEVQRRFKDMKIDWVYEQPYYRLNAGAFYTKLEAAGLQQKLIEAYPDAYIFKNSQVRPGDMDYVSPNATEPNSSN